MTEDYVMQTVGQHAFYYWFYFYFTGFCGKVNLRA